MSCHHLDCPKIRFPHHSRTSWIPPKTSPKKKPTCNVWGGPKRSKTSKCVFFPIFSSGTWNIRWGIRLTKASGSFHRMGWTCGPKRLTLTLKKRCSLDFKGQGSYRGFKQKNLDFCGTKIQKKIHGERIFPKSNKYHTFWNRAAEWQSWGPLILVTQQMIINHNYTLHSRYLIYSDMELYNTVILSNVSFFGWRARTCTCPNSVIIEQLVGTFKVDFPWPSWIYLKT